MKLYISIQVACRQLGFSRGMEIAAKEGNDQGTGTIWLDEVSCTKTDTRLLDCGHDAIGVSDCGHNEDVYLACYSKLTNLLIDLILFISAYLNHFPKYVSKENSVPPEYKDGFNGRDVLPDMD